MSQKYHIGKNGPAPCRASKRACRFGGDNTHYTSLDDAQHAYEKDLHDKTIPVSISFQEEKQEEKKQRVPFSIPFVSSPVSKRKPQDKSSASMAGFIESYPITMSNDPDIRKYRSTGYLPDAEELEGWNDTKLASPYYIVARYSGLYLSGNDKETLEHPFGNSDIVGFNDVIDEYSWARERLRESQEDILRDMSDLEPTEEMCRVSLQETPEGQYFLDLCEKEGYGNGNIKKTALHYQYKRAEEFLKEMFETYSHKRGYREDDWEDVWE